MPNVLDRFIPRADVTDDHARLVEAPAEIVYDVARQFDLESIPMVHAIFWLRGKLLRSKAPPAPRGSLVETTRTLGWGVLEEVPGERIVVGAVTKPWEADPVFRAVEPDRFLTFDEPDLVKIAWTFETESEGPNMTRLRSQTRAVATDEEARRKFKRYWRKVGVGVHAIRFFVLPAIRREAERRYRREGPRGGAVGRPI